MSNENEIVEDTDTVVEETQPVAPVKENLAEINWKQANEVMRLQKQRIEELEARNAPKSAIVEEEQEIDELEGLDSEDVITVEKHRKIRESDKKRAEKVAAKTAKQIVNEYMQQQSVSQDETRMRAKCEDYDYVMENFAIPMIKNDPALAYKVQNSKNPAEIAYKLAKISDEYEMATMKQQTSPRAEKVLKNSQRPTSVNAANNSLKSQAEDFSKLSPQQTWEMSQKYARG